MSKATELKQKFSAQMEKLIDLIESDEINAEVETFFNVMSRFHHYSLRNQHLIMMQSPNATMVAGFKAWHAFGRHVMSKQRGIKILRPITYQKKDSEFSEDDPRSKGMSFAVTHVWDVSQTDGADMPDLTSISGDDHSAVLDRMMQFATDNKITVGWSDTGAAKGWAQPDQKLINLSDKIDKNEAVGVLAHELAHIMIDQSGKPGYVREYEAELTAYLVCERFGIDSKAPHYIKTYTYDDDGELRKDLTNALNAVSNFTKKLIDGVAA